MTSVIVRAALKEGGRGAELLRGAVEEEIAHPNLSKDRFWPQTLQKRGFSGRAEELDCYNSD